MRSVGTSSAWESRQLSRPRLTAGVFLLVGLMGAVFISPAAADTQSDAEWLQYRHVATKNAVITTDSDVFTGELSTPNQVRATPVVADGKVFVGNHDSGDLQAFDLSTGEQLWHAQAPNWVHSEMIYHDGHVYVGYGNRFFQDNGLRGTGESGVLCLDAESGEVAWQYDTPGEVMPTPAVVDGSLYVVTGDRHLYQLDPQTGEERSVTEIGHTVSMSAPAVAGSMLYFGSGAPQPYTFFAYDTSAGDFAWSTPFEDFRAGLDDVPPAVADGIVVTTANRGIPDTSSGQTRAEHVAIAMDAETGEVLWQKDVGIGERPKNNRSGAPIIAGGTVFFGSPTTKRAYAYDLHSGEQLWSYDTGPIKGAPVAKDGTVFFSTTEGKLFALDAGTGQKQGEIQLSEEPLAPAGPIIVNDTLVVSSQDTNVYMLPISEVTAGDAGADSSNAAQASDASDAGAPWGWIGGGIGAVVIILVLAGVILMRKQRRRT